MFYAYREQAKQIGQKPRSVSEIETFEHEEQHTSFDLMSNGMKGISRRGKSILKLSFFVLYLFVDCKPVC